MLETCVVQCGEPFSKYFTIFISLSLMRCAFLFYFFYRETMQWLTVMSAMKRQIWSNTTKKCMNRYAVKAMTTRLYCLLIHVVYSILCRWKMLMIEVKITKKYTLVWSKSTRVSTLNFACFSSKQFGLWSWWIQWKYFWTDVFWKEHWHIVLNNLTFI